VSLEWKGQALDFAWMAQKNPVFGSDIKDRDAFARALGVSAADLAPPPPQVVSCGVPFLFAALLTRRAVDRVSVDAAGYASACRAAGIENLPLFVFTTDATGATSDEAVYSRMLAPAFGIFEDPATGGASGPLGCYLLRHAMVERRRLTHIVSLQGVKMKRPSRIHISIEATGEEITRVRVGGRSVLVGDGRLTW
jgi:trans-2,3-dihydro-3-hydroxyanthranilate isomerase